MAKLSIIVPYCNEYPMIYFTICNLRCELEQSDIDWEIITIANQSKDRSLIRLKALTKSNRRIKALEYNDHQSHWNAKNHGVLNSTGDILFFIDSHCILTKNALVNLFKFYIEHQDELHGTLNLPILYMNELAGRELEYKLQANITEKMLADNNLKNTPHNLHYSFTRYKHTTPYHRVSCMSTCGMMISRDLLVNELQLWPTNMTAYGGGENFINFCLAVMGYHVNVFSRPNAVHHFAEKRGYSWNYDGWIKNRIIASYLCGGEEWARVFALNVRGKKKVLERILNEVLKEHKEHRDHIATRQIMTPSEWVEQEIKEKRSIGIFK